MIGYHTPSGYNGIIASERDRYLNLIYYTESNPIQTSTLTIQLRTNGDMNDFINGNSIIYLKSGSNIVDNQHFDSNGIAVFSNINTGSYTLEILFTTNPPASEKTYSIGTKNILVKFPTQQVIMEANTENSGLFLVEDSTWKETEITPEFIATLTSDMKSTYIAIHVCTEELISRRCDYYVRCRDLTGERLATESTTKQWATSNVLFPNVSTNNTTEYNGRKQTYYMIYDATTLGIQSPAANLATSQTLNGMPGFIGTPKQLDVICGNSGNINIIKDILTNLGYSNIDYRNLCWSSIQSSSERAFGYYSWIGRWSDSEASSIKTRGSNIVLPLFSK